jgi:hypothetical protein
MVGLVNSKGFGRKNVWPNLRYNLPFSLKNCEKNTKNLRIVE